MLGVVYLDASALVKLVVADEPEGAALAAFLAEAHSTEVSSEIAAVEVSRAARRRGAPVARIDDVMARVALVELTPEIAAAASAVEPPTVRTLDAIHVATAASFGTRLECLVAYDERLLGVARALGLPVASPA